MKRRLLLSAVVVTCLVVVALPVAAQPSKSCETPAWFDILATWFQGGVQQVMGLVSESTPADPAEEPPPLIPVDDSGPDQSGTDPGTESSPEIDPDG